MSEGTTVFGKLKPTDEDFVIARIHDAGMKFLIIPRAKFDLVTSDKAEINMPIPSDGLVAATRSGTRQAVFEGSVICNDGHFSFVNGCWVSIEQE